MSRRAFLAGLGAAAGVSLAPFVARAEDGPRLPRGLFTLGVASGDPASDGVVLWTRLSPEPQTPGGGMPAIPVPVRWEVARDERFRHLEGAGWTLAHPAHAHAVHVAVEGLRAGRTYWYRFRAGHELSPVGRTRTAPELSDHGPRLRFAFASCQDWQDGLYTAYEHLVREDLDLVVFLGDYIYEAGPNPSAIRQHTGTGEPITLDEYRARYALYRSDPLLQAAHAAFPWVVTFDDHEVDNDWSGDVPQDPAQQPTDAFLARRAAAFQAYWEHMPLRRAQQPSGPSIRIYRRLRLGGLADLHVLDTRQYRSLTEPCGYGTGPLCPEVLDPARTMVGDEQERWLFEGLARSRARWNVLAQQVPVTRLDVGGAGGPEYKLDKWDAYPVARERLLRFLASARVPNPVVITGDLHDAWVAHLKPDFDDPASAVVASEFVGTSISSDGDGAETSEDGQAVAANGRNPHVIFHNYRRGYSICEVTRRQWRTDFRVVPFVSASGAPVSTVASFVLEDGQPAVQPA